MPATERKGKRTRGTGIEAARGGLREMSLMHVFRAAAQARDSRARAHRNADGEDDLTVLAQKRREGVSEASLRQNLARDIASLMNTIRLDVMVDMSDTPYVRRSVVNFGFQDMDTLWRTNRTPADMAEMIRQTLIDNEPRLRPETIEVRLDEEQPSPDQRLLFVIAAEMISDPADIPLQFLAEVDAAAGKIVMNRMQGDS